MNIGNYKYRCTIYETLTARDSTGGNLDNELNELYNRQCNYTLVQGKETPIANQQTPVYNAQIKMRYISGVSEIHLVLVDNILYQITSVIHDDKKREMTLSLSKTKHKKEDYIINHNPLTSGGVVV